MRKLVHIRGYLEKNSVKFALTTWSVTNVDGDTIHVLIGEDPMYPSTILPSMIGKPMKEVRTIPNEHLGTILVEKGNEEEGKRLLVASAIETTEDIVRSLSSAVQVFKNKKKRLDIYSKRLVA